MGFLIGVVFEYFIHVEAFGLNRYLFVFLIPIAIIQQAPRRREIVIIVSMVCFGLFASDFADFINFIATYHFAFISVYLYYCVALFYINKLRRS
jgi:hypothetical protein